MPGFDYTQHTRYTLIKSKTGKNVGLAFVPPGVDVKSDDLFTVGEDLRDAGGEHHATQMPRGGSEADLSHIFVEDSVSSDNVASMVADNSRQGSSNLLLHHNASGMVSSLAEEMLEELGGSRKVKQETQVFCTKLGVQREENKQREDLLGCGLVEGKEELDKPGRFGWIREVVTHFTKSHITGVKYITPPHPITGIRKRVSTKKEIMEILEMHGTAGGKLSFRNFNFNTRVLNLSPEFEVIRRSMARGSNMVPPP